MNLNDISYAVIGSAIEVHKHLGPGLLESTYEECMLYELKKQNLHVSKQMPLPVIYKEHLLDFGYRLDLLVENAVVVELKSVETLLPIHEAQILTYLKFAEKELGLLINFNVTVLKNGIKRFRM